MKTTYFLLFLLCLSIPALGQFTDSTFQLSFDVGGAEVALGIAPLDSGFLLVGGGLVYDTTFSSGFWAGSLDSKGQLQGHQTYGEPGKSWGSNRNNDLIQTTAGTFIFSGAESDGISKWFPLVLWFDSTGQLLRKEIYPDSLGSAILQNGLQQPDSTYLFYGMMYGAQNPWDVDRYLLKLDKEGNKLWSKTYGGNFDDRSRGPALVRRKNGLVLSGYTDSYTQYGGRDGWLIYTNFEGQVIREKFFGTQGDDGWIQIALAPDSLSLYLTQRIDTLLQPGFSPWAYQVMKLDPNGNPEWRLILQDSLSRYASGIYTLDNGDLLVYGILDIFHSPPSDYGWLARISAQGDLLWERAYQYSDDEFPQKISLSNWILDVLEVENGNILFVGSTTLRNEFGGQNPWIVQVDSNGCFSTHCDSLPAPFTGPPTALEAEPEQLVRMYPNPAQDHLIIQIAAPQLPASFTLLDVQGRTVSQQLITQPQSKLDVSSFPPGLYVGKIIASQGEVVQQKVVIAR